MQKQTQNLKIDYEIFHNTTSIQIKVIKNNNFTYRILLEIINYYLKSPKNILDIGCGAGALGLYLANNGNTVLGIDISQKAVESANESAKYLGFKKAKFQKMNFPNKVPNKKFDMILFTEVIEHLENDDLALKKIYNLLKPEGIVIISTPSKNAPLHKLGLAKEFDKKVGHLRRYTLEELIKKANKYEFKILETKKVEGIIRNFLFLNPIAGKFIRFIKFFLSDWVTFIDNISLKLFGESNIILILQKPSI